jgi:hypothetical protein
MLVPSRIPKSQQRLPQAVMTSGSRRTGAKRRSILFDNDFD